jgi:hypothetical protein
MLGGIGVNRLLKIIALIMTTSKLISLWYAKFCIEQIKPKLSFETFCILMKQNDFDFAQAMECYKSRFLID